MESFDSPTMSSGNTVIAFQKIPLTALSKRTLQRLSRLLNSNKILHSEAGYERDWRGLADLAGVATQNVLCVEDVICLKDPITSVIRLWCTNNPQTATFGYLQQFLGIIDRWDVFDDIYENLVEDSTICVREQGRFLDLRSDTNLGIRNFNGDFSHGSDANILTTADVIRAQKGLAPQLYDAFVLFADADIHYAIELLTKFEDNPEYGLKLCLKERDLLAGVQFEHVALTQLIGERCKHLIVILTREFLKSPENKFLVNYTQALQIQRKTRKIIPLLYEDNINIPRTLKIYTLLRYNTSSASLFNFWEKLANSIRNVNGITDANTASLSSLNTNAIYPGTSNHSSNTSTKEENELINSSNPLNGQTDKEQPVLEDGMVLHTSYLANTTSTSSDNKEKKKWPCKVLKNIFRRSNCKLQKT